MTRSGPEDLSAAFAAAMDRLGPFEENPALAVAVSGGADSMALALLARGWTGRRGGSVLALVVDHAIRPDSAAEAATTIRRLGAASIRAALLTLSGLQRGAALAERARIARYDALTSACRSRGLLHLLLGHHAADQAETLMMRVLSQSGPAGLAGMPALAESRDTRLLRPLLAIEPVVLRSFLRQHLITWVEDPSNRDLTALRPRLRQLLNGAETTSLTEAARTAGAARARAEAGLAAELAVIATIRPEGFARIPLHRLSPHALSALVQLIGGSAYSPSLSQMTDLAAAPRPATVAGVRIVAAGESLLLVREEAAMGDPVAATHGVLWDGRMRLSGCAPDGAMAGALAQDAAAFRRQSSLPSVVLRTMPALRLGKLVVAVPHLGYVSDRSLTGLAFRFDPPRPCAGGVFHPV